MGANPGREATDRRFTSLLAAAMMSAEAIAAGGRVLAAPWAGMLLCAKPHFGEQFSSEPFVAHGCATKGTCGIIGE